MAIPNTRLIRAREGWAPPKITSIAIGYARTTDVLEILTSQSFDSLTSFSWCGSFGEAFSTPSSPVAIRGLRELSCLGMASSYLSELFTSVTLPAITSIEIGEHRAGKDWKDETPLVALLERSKPPLRRLKFNFQNSRVAVEKVVHILRVCPDLTHLEVWVHCGFVGGLLDRLTITDKDDDQGVLVPKLAHLRLHELLNSSDAPWSKEMQEQIVCMAESRSSDAAHLTAISPLRALRVSASMLTFGISGLDIVYEEEKREFDRDAGLEARVHRLIEEGTECSLAWISHSLNG
ncbi:hypothetical protein VNI00_009026 [Paramarasmius palmivorus]|uniref:F-box protein n=1 Tax=Paramarasmius palmivorus TaxID=297713 RepID=A0AAW0CRW1_9AGAR